MQQLHLWTPLSSLALLGAIYTFHIINYAQYGIIKCGFHENKMAVPSMYYALHDYLFAESYNSGFL